MLLYNEAMVRFAATILIVLTLAVGPASAATVLYCPFDSLDGWSVRTVGASGAELVEKTDENRCVEVTSHRGTVLLSRELPLDEVRGCRLAIACSVKSGRIVRGPQASSTGKVHLAVQTPRGIEHHYARFSEAKDWHQQGLDADVPEDAQRVLLNLGLESCSGQVRFDRLIVRNDRPGAHRIDITPIINAGHEQLQLDAFPSKAVQWNEIPFQIVDGAAHRRLDCFRLKGIDHTDWPSGLSKPLPVNRAATAIYILHAALGGRESSESPAAIWTAHFVGGHESSFSVFEGRDLGAVDHGEKPDLENWHVAWRQKDTSGNWITFGVAKWTIYGTMPIKSLSCQAYSGAAPVVLAITVVEEPPKPADDQFEGINDAEGFQ